MNAEEARTLTETAKDKQVDDMIMSAILGCQYKVEIPTNIITEQKLEELKVGGYQVSENTVPLTLVSWEE